MSAVRDGVLIMAGVIGTYVVQWVCSWATWRGYWWTSTAVDKWRLFKKRMRIRPWTTEDIVVWVALTVCGCLFLGAGYVLVHFIVKYW